MTGWMDGGMESEMVRGFGAWFEYLIWLDEFNTR